MPFNPLVGQVPVEINNVAVASITKVTIKRARQVTVKFGAFGPIGSGKGFYKVQGTLTLAVPKAGLEIDLQALSDSEEGFSITFPKGAEKWACYGTHLSDDEISNTPEPGDTEVMVNFVAAEMLRIA
jgi:hypothetical protein